MHIHAKESCIAEHRVNPFLAALLTLLLFLASFPAVTNAREIYRENFSSLTAQPAEQGFPSNFAGRAGGGWSQPNTRVFLSDQIDLKGVDRGMISFDLKRLPGATQGHSDTVLTLMGPDSQRLFTLRVQWASSFDKNKTTFVLTSGGGKSYSTQAIDLWDPEILLDRTPDENRWVHYDLVWSDKDAVYELYADGARQKSHQGTLDRASGKVLPDRRKEKQKEFAKVQGAPKYASRPFSYFIRDASMLRVGFGGNQPRNPKAETPIMSWAVIDNLAVVVGESVAENPDVGASGARAGALATARSDSGVTLSWSPPVLRGVNQTYSVYRRDAATLSPKLLGSTYDLAYTDSTALQSVSYEYSIKASYNGRESSRGEVVTSDPDRERPEPPRDLVADTPWYGEVRLVWNASSSEDVKAYRVYRSLGEAAPLAQGTPLQVVSALEFIDREVIPGFRYNYLVSAEDHSSNVSLPSGVASAVPLPGDGPQIKSVAITPGARSFRPGQKIIAILNGQARATGSLEIQGTPLKLELKEVVPGKYTASYTIREENAPPHTTAYTVIAKLVDSVGQTTVAGPSLSLTGRDVLDDVTPPVITSVEHNAREAAGMSGALVAGDRLNIILKGEPDCYARFKIVGGVGESAELQETEPGVYTGSYKVTDEDKAERAVVAGFLADEAGNEIQLNAKDPIALDTRLRLTVAPEERFLQADKASKSRIRIKVANANGAGVPDREMRLTLSTIEDYTGVVGGGGIGGSFASRDDSDDLEVRWGGAEPTSSANLPLPTRPGLRRKPR